MNGPVWAAIGSQMDLMEEVRLEAQLGLRRVAVDFVVTPHVEFLILGEGCLQDLRLLWDHCLNEVVVEGVHHKLRNLPSGRVSTRWIMLQWNVVLPARCLVDLIAQVVYQRLTQPSEGTWSTTVGEIHPGVMVARTLVPDPGRDLRVLNLIEAPLRLVAEQDLGPSSVLPLESAPPSTVDSVTVNGTDHLQPLLEGLDPTVPVTCRDTLADILCQHADVFSKGEDDLGCTDFLQHWIDTEKQRPFRQQLRRYPDKYVEAIDEQVKTFLRQGLIRPSRSEWGSTVMMVKKSDGSLRFCINLTSLPLRTATPSKDRRVPRCLGWSQVVQYL